ncbi:micronuclear linker histone polyprotein-like [Argopecten irradians]|uniref:micronuclear linker histone polyprotein-like n=1 Tax=Argopecten irradians TaxID=31199 RepID=UPI003717B785
MDLAKLVIGNKKDGMKNTVMLNNFMKEGNPNDNACPSSPLSKGNIEANGESAKNLTNSLLDTFKSGLSAPNNNKKTPVPTENGILSQLRSSSAKTSNETTNEHDNRKKSFPKENGILSQLKSSSAKASNDMTCEPTNDNKKNAISKENRILSQLKSSFAKTASEPVSEAEDNRKKSVPKENRIMSQFKSPRAKTATEPTSDRDVLSLSQSSKKSNSSKVKGLVGRESVSSRGKPRQSLEDSIDDELEDLDSDSEPGTPEPPAPSFWSTFEDSILKINDQTDHMSLKPRPNFDASDDFKGVMTAMFGNTEYGRAKSYTLLKEKINRLTNVSGMASRLFRSAAKDANKEEEEEDQEETEEEREAAKANEMENIRSELKGAKRGWKLLRRNVNETALAENTKESKLKWTMVSHHVTRLTDLDKARQDLYERYGIVPVTQEDGTMQCKNVMWSKRAISLNMTHPSFYKMPSSPDDKKKKKKNRAQSAHVPSNNSRPLTAGRRVNIKTIPNRPASESRILR